MASKEVCSSAQVRRPTERLAGYDQSGGCLETLLKSVGQKQTLLLLESLAIEQSRQQAAATAARGNAARPGALPRLKRKAKDCKDEDVNADDGDNEAGSSLLEYELDDLENKVDRMEWLCQAIEQRGDPTNYCDMWGYQDKDALQEVWQSCLWKRSNIPNGSEPTGKGLRIQKGSTQILKPSTNRNSSGVKLVRTDKDTIGLDRTQVASRSHKEHGHGPAPKLARTNQSTIGLDGNTPSHPRIQAPRRKPLNPAPPPPTNPASTKLSNNKPVPSKKRAIVPLARIQALCEANARKETANRAAANQPVGRSSLSSKPASRPARPIAPRPSHSSDVEMADANDWPLTPPTENNQDPQPQNSQEEAGLDGDVNEDSNDTDLAGFRALTKRHQAQLKAFNPEARQLVKWTTEQVRLRLITICPFPERITKTAKDKHNYLESWMPGLWDMAHEEMQEGQAKLLLKDHYANYICNQLPVARNLLRKICDPLVAIYFDLRQSNPNHAAIARDLTDGSGKKWLLPNLENDALQFQHPVIGDVIWEAFFKSPQSIGHRFLEEFAPLVLLPAVAYTCSIIRHRIKLFEAPDNSATDLNSKSNSDAFTMYMDMLEKHGKENPAQLLKARIIITANYLKSQPKQTTVAAPPMNFAPDRDVNRKGLEEIKELLGDAVPNIDNWEDVKAVYAQKKGKGRALEQGRASGAGPSASTLTSGVGASGAKG